MQSLDFPVLVADGGRILEHELGVKSKLHREQLIRAFKRVILGIGTAPSPPKVVPQGDHTHQTKSSCSCTTRSALECVDPESESERCLKACAEARDDT